MTFQFLVVEGEFLVFKVFPLDRVQQRSLLLKKRISERIVEQIAVSRAFGEGLQDFRPVQSSSSSLHVPAGVQEALNEPGEGVFHTFHHHRKKSEVGFALESESARKYQPIHAGCPAASRCLGDGPHW